jgi:hypothetical protein
LGYNKFNQDISINNKIMANVILLDKEKHNIKEDNLPCLISYAPKTGGSHFSMTMVANLFLQGSKILILTAYPMAKDNFLQQTKGEESNTAYITDENQLNTDTQAIILESGNEQLFLKAIEKLDDINDRVILVKNMEVFSDTAIESTLNFPKIILSGDIDKCSAKKQISQKDFKTTILFSKPEIDIEFNPPVLEKYEGYLWCDDIKGRVSVVME